MTSLFGVDFCQCDEPEEEVLDGIVFCANCHGVVGYEAEKDHEEGLVQIG